MSSGESVNRIKLPSISTQAILNTLIKSGADVKVISKRFKLLKITQNKSSFFIKGTSFHLNSQPSSIISNNKYLTKLVLRDAGITVPKSFLVKSASEARKTISEKNFYPCVLKPSVGAHGNKVYANIESANELEKVLPNIFSEKGKEEILIEEHIDGPDYRVLVVGDKASAVMERIPAHVVGDAQMTIKQLISQFNNNPLVGKKYEKPMCKIRLNGEVRRNLEKKGINFSYIPKKGEQIFLRQNANISTGGIGKDATDEAPEIVKTIAIQAAKSIGMSITGVDIIYNKLTKKAYVIELNDQPGIDIHHFPVIGRSRNVAKDIVNLLLSNLSNQAIPTEASQTYL